jgi:parallel beta-helix repeat protein
MKRKAALGLVLMLLTTCVFNLTVNTRIVLAYDVIYIRPDGSVNPPNAPIARDGNVYTFTANVSEPIVIQKDSVVVDGNGYWLLGSGENYGLFLYNRSNVTIRKTHITGYMYAVEMNLSTGNTVVNNFLEKSENAAVSLESSTTTSIINNTISRNLCGIYLEWSDNNNITGNEVKNNPFGIWILGSSSNTVRNNTIANNSVSGMELDQSSTTITHNDFIKNTAQATTSNSTNTWDSGYPFGGNYWSDSKGTDLHRGAYQNESGSDGICDAPYVIDANNTDRYPLMSPSYTASLPGDLNGDGKVSLPDLVILALAYGSIPGDIKWNPVADIDGNGVVGLTDLVILAKNYGKAAS